jgi:hypothetical protein
VLENVLHKLKLVMKIKTQWRQGFGGMDMIIGMFVLVVPMIGMVMLMMIDTWKVMRVHNNMNMMSYQLSTRIANFVTEGDIQAAPMELENLALTFCPKGLDTTLGFADNGDYDVAGQFQIVVQVPHKFKWYSFDFFSGKAIQEDPTSKMIAHTSIFPSLSDLNGSFEFTCQ